MAEGKGDVLTNQNYSSSIAGAWILDLSRSDTMVEYLRTLGTPEIAIRSQVAREQGREIRNAIVLNEILIVIFKRTAMNRFTLTYIFGEELVTHSALGPRRSTAHLNESGRLDGFVITSNFESPVGEALVVESCKLAEGGRTFVQEINLRSLNTGRGNITRRVWSRVPMTDEDREHLRGE